MRLCILTDFFVPHYQGGGERRHYEILKRLVKKGYHVDLLCMRIKGVPDFENIEGIHVYHIGPRISRPPRRNPLDFLCFMLSACFWLMGRRYDLIEANPWVSMIPVSLAGKLKGVKTTAVIHDISSGGSDQWLDFGRLAESIEKCLVRLPFDKVICVSTGVRDKLISRYGLKEENITLIHNGVDINLMDSIKATTKEERTVIFIGRLIPHKHVDDLLRAIDLLRQSIPDAKLKVIGSGQEYEPLLKLVGELKLEKNVKFFGKMDYTDLIIELKKSSVLALPSTREGFGMVLVEAFACHVPCVAYYSDGVTDVISNRRNGFLVKQRDIKSLSSKIEYLLKNKTKAMLFAKSGRAKVEKYFSWDIIADKIDGFYQQLVRH